MRLVEGAGHATPQFDAPDLLAEVAAFLSAALQPHP
jgi:hypothetical protein